MNAPRGVRCLTLCRSRSPELIEDSCGNLCSSRSDCVPFPTPGAPTRITRAAFRKRIVWRLKNRVAWTGVKGCGIGFKQEPRTRGDAAGGPVGRYNLGEPGRAQATWSCHCDRSAGNNRSARNRNATEDRRTTKTPCLAMSSVKVERMIYGIENGVVHSSSHGYAPAGNKKRVLWETF